MTSVDSFTDWPPRPNQCPKTGISKVAITAIVTGEKSTGKKSTVIKVQDKKVPVKKVPVKKVHKTAWIGKKGTNVYF